jgi:hypothetical protein
MNHARTASRQAESLTVFVDSSGWNMLIDRAEEEIIGPLRARALHDAKLDPREQTGVVRALGAIKAILYLPYEKLAEQSGKPLEEYLPDKITRLFE